MMPFSRRNSLEPPCLAVLSLDKQPSRRKLICELSQYFKPRRLLRPRSN